MIYNPQKHHRKSIRLKGYDYSRAGLYFITICCQDRAHLFGHIENGQMILNKFGEIAFSEWAKTTQIRTNCQLHEFIIMPNHIHGIIEIIFQKEEEKNEIGAFKSPSQTIGSIIRGFKIATIKRIKDFIQDKDINNYSTGESQFAPFAPTDSYSTKKIKSLDFKIWQRNYYEHIIRNEQAFHRKSEYIINNPKKWENDKLK
ncbi:MAG: transposase [Pyrinomonadaceae bacterium]